MAAWWLGQSGYVLRSARTTVALDPFLGAAPPGRERLVEPPLAATELAGLDLLLITHDDPDAFDRATVVTLLAASPQALLVLPAPLADVAADELRVADERLLPLRAGDLYTHQDLRLHAVPAAHESLLRDDRGDLRQLGYVLQWPAATVYAAGDTVPYRDQVATLQPFNPQVVLLPINGRDVRRRQRDLAGCLSVAEAARLASDLRAELLVPTHFGVFADDSADPATLQSFCATHDPALQAALPELGERVYWPR
ncbi:MAG: MBL fold metallo-hydrolase [Fimbriimonadaceae bacterium]|nr:MBL fold metallo-hydrolase [Fimbriimonadaceae bacterium]